MEAMSLSSAAIAMNAMICHYVPLEYFFSQNIFSSYHGNIFIPTPYEKVIFKHCIRVYVQCCFWQLKVLFLPFLEKGEKFILKWARESGKL